MKTQITIFFGMLILAGLASAVDFTTWTETDPGAVITVSSDNITFTHEDNAAVFTAVNSTINGTYYAQFIVNISACDPQAFFASNTLFLVVNDTGNDSTLVSANTYFMFNVENSTLGGSPGCRFSWWTNLDTGQSDNITLGTEYLVKLSYYENSAQIKVYDGGALFYSDSTSLYVGASLFRYVYMSVGMPVGVLGFTSGYLRDLSFNSTVAPAVVVTPLFPNNASTLTCRYVDTYTGETAKYRWYDGEDGVWYNTGSTATYSSLSPGYDYNCSVNITLSGVSSDWVNSDNSVTVTTECLDPCPMYYMNTAGKLNLTSAIASAGTLPLYTIGCGYGTTSDHNKYIGDDCFIFYCGNYNTTGGVYSVDTFWQEYYNVMYGETAAGTFSLGADTTDENLATEDSFVTTSDSYVYSTYTGIDDTIPTGTWMRYKFGLWSGNPGNAVYIVIQGYNPSGWDTLAGNSTSLGVEQINTFTLQTTEDYSQIRVGIQRIGGVPAFNANGRIYEIEMLNWTSGNMLGTAVTPSAFTITNFTSTGGYLYNISYVNEETAADFDFLTTGDLNESEIRVSCTVGYTNINNTNHSAGVEYLIGTTSDLRHTQTMLTYDDGSQYYRRITPICESDYYLPQNIFMADAGSVTVRAYTFTLNDLSGDSSYENGWLKVKRTVGAYGSNSIIEEKWPADNSILAYLVDNREYTISLDASDCSETSLGYVTTNPADTTYSLTVSGDSSYDLTPVGDIFHYLYFNVKWINSSNRINCTFYDEKNETAWFWWGVYYANNDSLAYSDNTTSHDYHSSYLANTNYRYYAVIEFDHPRGSHIRIIEGLIYWYEDYFDALMWGGEIAGLEAPTFYLLLALTIVALTPLIGSSANVGFTVGAVMFEVISFSILGWLPFMTSSNSNGLLLIFVFGIIGLIIAYVYRGGKL